MPLQEKDVKPEAICIWRLRFRFQLQSYIPQMSKAYRHTSCRIQRTNRTSALAIEPEAMPKDAAPKPTDSYEIKLSLLDRPAVDFRTPRLDSDSHTATTPSRSKFLQKFNNIRSSRESIEHSRSPNIEEERRKEEFETNKKKLFFSSRLLSARPLSSLASQIPEDSLHLNQSRRTPLNERRRSRALSPAVEPPSLRTISPNQLVLMKEEGKNGQEGLTGYWTKENKFVSLIPLATNEKVNFDHPSILPIYAEVTIATKRYVVSDEYKNCSLKNLIEEFGPFDEQLVKRYLKQVALGLQHMHFHRRAHNRLSATAIHYNKNGELFINAVTATSLIPSKDELIASRELYYFAPEFLLAKGHSKSLKNDVWGLGCLAVLMLTATALPLSPFHPYNAHPQHHAHEKMIDNIKQLHKQYFSQTTQPPKAAKSIHEGLSEAAKSFISKCLQPLCEDRPNLETILDHEFLEGV